MSTKLSNLLDWLKAASDEDVRATGTTREYLRLIAYGHKKASPGIAVRTEIASQGKVTRQQLRPRDWRQLWPELGSVEPVADQQGVACG